MTKKKSQSYPDTARWFPDENGIICCECPACKEFIPNVYEGKEVTCVRCKHKFKVVN